MVDGPPRLPNDWPDAQRAFTQAYRTAPGAFPRTPVFLRWRHRGSRGPERWTATSFWFVERIATGWPSGLNVAIWPIDAPRRAPADLVVTVRGLPSLAGESEGVVAGELALNGTFCIEVGGQVLWPSYNPGIPARRPRR